MQARPRPAASPLPAVALFFTLSFMLWFGWWAFWSVR
jgi:hypothetical protein